MKIFVHFLGITQSWKTFLAATKLTTEIIGKSITTLVSWTVTWRGWSIWDCLFGHIWTSRNSHGDLGGLANDEVEVFGNEHPVSPHKLSLVVTVEAPETWCQSTFSCAHLWFYYLVVSILLIRQSDYNFAFFWDQSPCGKRSIRSWLEFSARIPLPTTETTKQLEEKLYQPTGRYKLKKTADVVLNKKSQKGLSL